MANGHASSQWLTELGWGKNTATSRQRNRSFAPSAFLPCWSWFQWPPPQMTFSRIARTCVLCLHHRSLYMAASLLCWCNMINVICTYITIMILSYVYIYIYMFFLVHVYNTSPTQCVENKLSESLPLPTPPIWCLKNVETQVSTLRREVDDQRTKQVTGQNPGSKKNPRNSVCLTHLKLLFRW